MDFHDPIKCTSELKFFKIMTHFRKFEKFNFGWEVSPKTFKTLHNLPKDFQTDFIHQHDSGKNTVFNNKVSEFYKQNVKILSFTRIM